MKCLPSSICRYEKASRILWDALNIELFLALDYLMEGLLALLDDALFCKICRGQRHLKVCNFFAVYRDAATLYELTCFAIGGCQTALYEKRQYADLPIWKSSSVNAVVGMFSSKAPPPKSAFAAACALSASAVP